MASNISKYKNLKLKKPQAKIVEKSIVEKSIEPLEPEPIVEKIVEPSIEATAFRPCFKKPVFKKSTEISLPTQAPSATPSPQLTTKPTKTKTKTPTEIIDSAFHALEKTVDGSIATINKVAKPITPLSEKSLTVKEQILNPTIEDLSKFTFKEQPEKIDSEIMAIFETLMNKLETEIGAETPTNVANCLDFLKANSFLVGILKPATTGILVDGLRRSYSFIHKVQEQKVITKEKKNQRKNAMSNMLNGISI